MIYMFTIPQNAHQNNQTTTTQNHQHKPTTSTTQTTMINRYHTHNLSPNQCGSIIAQTINAPLPIVWSLVRQFDNPQSYKQFIKKCAIVVGDGGSIGSVREVSVKSGLPAETSIERLDELDDEMHVMTFSIIGGDHRLVNYQSTTTLHEDDDCNSTVVIESYVVDVPPGSSKDDTCSFADTIIGCNLRSLARMSENMASNV